MQFIYAKLYMQISLLKYNQLMSNLCVKFLPCFMHMVLDKHSTVVF